jgi:hypothetical protein
MDEMARTGAPEMPPVAALDDGTPPRAPARSTGLADSRALTILTTEHWSLLSARGLVYNEAFARGGMYLTFLSATLVALGLVSTGTGFSPIFLLIALVVLALDLFIGVATIGRMATATSEDLRYLQGMGRIRHAYFEMVPGLDEYFITTGHDDMSAVAATYGVTADPTTRSSVMHGLTTAVAMIGVINAALGGVLLGVLALLAGGAAGVAAIAAIAGFAAGLALNVVYMTRAIAATQSRLAPRFPTPPHESTRPIT